MSTVQSIQVVAVVDAQNVALTWNSETRTIPRQVFNDLVNNFGLRNWDFLIQQIAVELSNRSIEPLTANNNQIESVINALNLKF